MAGAVETSRSRLVRADIQADLRRATRSGKVVYLEGASDYDALLALLGQAPAKADTRSGLVDGVFVRGLDSHDAVGGSGKRAVMQRLKLAQTATIDGIYGVVDRDGEEADSTSNFGSGPLFTWPAYCIENLLAQALDGYDALASMGKFAAYVAHNRSGLADQLRDLGLTRHIKPTDPLLDLAGMQAKYREFDLEQQVDRLAQLHEEFIRILHSQDSLRAHCWCDGKWLVNIDLANQWRVTPERSLELLLDKVRAAGGYQPAKDWWQSLATPNNN